MHIPLRSSRIASARAVSASPNNPKVWRLVFLSLLFGFAFYLAHIPPAHAGLYQEEDNDESNRDLTCGEPPNSSNSNSGGSDPGDASTKDRGQYGPCSAKPTPHISTPNISGFKDLNPNAYVPLKNKSDSNGSGGEGGASDRVWQDAAYGRGTPGDTPTTKRPMGDDNPINNNNNTNNADDSKSTAKPRLNAAKPMIKTQQKPKNRKEEACLNRVKWDNAVNQTIMESSRYPYNREDQRTIAWEDESKPGGKLSMKNHCQRLKMTYDPQEEYKAGDYLYTAYKKSLVDPTYRMTGSSSSTAFKTEPAGNMFAGMIPDAQAATGNGTVDEPGINGLKTYKNAYQDQPGMKNIRLNQLASVPYERINDVTHPWTPRWHYKNNERDEFSPKGKDYAKYEQDNVRCAGEAEKDKIKVDILEFRRPPFEKGINLRLDLNNKCWKDRKGSQVKACRFKNKPEYEDCWKCFDLNGKTDTPPCSTRHNQEDLSINIAKYDPGPDAPNLKLQCKTTAASLCEKLRAPYRMVNTLKIRRSQPGNAADRLPNGAPEGYSHKEYFGDRMPYPIQWDTGRPIQDIKSSSQNPFDYAGQYSVIVGVGREKAAPGSGSSTAEWEDENEKAFATLFGITSEAYAQSSGKKPGSNQKKDERCMMGGWGGNTSCAGMSFKKPDPMTSWTELKAYQARTTQDYSISCLGNYHKLFAPGNATDKALMRAGGVYEREICSRKDSKGNSTTCGNSGSSSGGSGGSGSSGGSQGKDFWEKRQQNWPLAYRGQMCDKKRFDEDEKKSCDQRQCFPFFGAKNGKCPQLKTGLDDVKPGDIILMFGGGVKEQSSSGGSSSGSSGSGNDDDKPLMPTVAYVKSAHNKASTKDYKDCSQDKNCNLIVESADDGQFPDACGNSFNWGTGLSRTLYKPGNMPESFKEKLKDIQKKNDVQNPTTDCNNPQFGGCEYQDWDKAKVYRPSEDVRDQE